MNKNQGATIGAILLAGLLLRPIGSNAPTADASKPDSASPTATEQSAGAFKGPWIASCKYWSPVRHDHAKKAKPANLHASLNAGRESAEWKLRVAEDQEDEETTCAAGRGDRWGLPSDTSPIRLRTMIATVPRPVHSHASLGFDRTIDAIVEAAEDNGYTSTYYWLPWKSRVQGGSASIAAGDKEPGHDPAREREPGLIILKYVPHEHEDNSPRDAFYKVIYLFIVGETATEGVNGDQLKLALSYQEEVAQRVHKRRNSQNWFDDCSSVDASSHMGCIERGRHGALSIIGPNYTGSAASLRATLDAHFLNNGNQTKPVIVQAAGITSSHIALEQLEEKAGNGVKIEYQSFSDDASYDHLKFRDLLLKSNGQYDPARVFELVEDNTARGQTALGQCVKEDNSGKCLSYEYEDPLKGGFALIRYPREISLLRNAQNGSGPGGSSSGIPSPYLQLSLKDTTSEDSVPHFSREDTPLSQEAELMTIARTLNKGRAQFVLITSSSILDELFLMQFLHRACPDVRLLFMGGDLLLEREVDNVPYIGSVTVSAYPLIGTGQSQKGGPGRAYANAASVAYYNAASYSFWDASSGTPLLLNSYSNAIEQSPPGSPRHPPLWETVIGSDGYYPLALLDECSTDSPGFQPAVGFQPAASPTGFQPTAGRSGKASESLCIAPKSPQMKDRPTLPVYPSLFWDALCVVIMMMCIFHSFAMLVADYWSPSTRDLAIRENVEPARRSMYVRIGTAMLTSMAFVIAWPIFPLRHLLLPSRPDEICAALVLLAGIVTTMVTTCRTWGELKWTKRRAEVEIFEDVQKRRRNNLCFLVSLLALVVLVGIPSIWIFLCWRGQAPGPEEPTYAGLMFAYRCIRPESGVSPVIPVLLLLFGWYLWAFCQTWRLRFSMGSRPIMPAKLAGLTSSFVSDEDLDRCRREGTDCGNSRNSCLYSNLTCILITRQLLRRFWQTSSLAPDSFLAIAYAGALILLLIFPPMHSLESLMRLTHFPDLPRLYERLVVLLFFPLLFISIAGWLRMVVIWGSLRRSLLERLENYQIRFAFSQLRDTGWMTMVRQGGLQEWWRDMARSSESMHQMLKDPELKNYVEMNSIADNTPLSGLSSNCQGARQSGSDVADYEDPCWKTMQAATAAFDERAKVLRARASSGKRYDEALRYRDMLDHIADKTPFSDLSSNCQVAGQSEGEVADYKDPYWKTMQAAADAFDERANVLRTRASSGKRYDEPLRYRDMLDHEIMHEIEEQFGRFAQGLLGGALMPFWNKRTQRFVESEDVETLPIKARRSEMHAESPHGPLELHATADQIDPLYIRIAEEFLAIRYVSLIRSVLVNMRCLMSFVTAAFVLAIIAWNSYPFEPRQIIDWIFTALLFLLGLGIVWVLAQMYRDPILSRITDTKANELGFEFWVRLVSLGAVPLLTWLAYTFPDVGSFLFKFFQPAVSVTH